MLMLFNSDKKPSYRETVVITGGGGFIGSNLAQFLTSKFRVVVLDLFAENPKNFKLLKSHGIIVKKVDIRNSNLLEKTVKQYKPSVIFHLAAQHFLPDCDKDPKKTWDTNYTGTKNLIEVMSKLPTIPYLVFSSSMAVYSDLGRAIKETDSTEPIDIYGKSKLAAEGLIKEMAQKSGLRYTIFRFANVYGTNPTVPHIIPRIVKQLHQNKKIELGNTAPRRDFIFVSDVVNALALAAQTQKQNATYNLGTGISTSINELVNTILELSQSTIPVVKSSQNLVRATDRQNLQANITRIQNELGWKPRISLETGLKTILAYERLLPEQPFLQRITKFIPSVPVKLFSTNLQR